jgi:hypothetical protein
MRIEKKNNTYQHQENLDLSAAKDRDVLVYVSMKSVFPRVKGFSS